MNDESKDVYTLGIHSNNISNSLSIPAIIGVFDDLDKAMTAGQADASYYANKTKTLDWTHDYAYEWLARDCSYTYTILLYELNRMCK